MVKYRDSPLLLSNGNIDASLWLKEIEETFSDKDREFIRKALELAEKTSGACENPLNVSCFDQGIVTGDILYGLGLDPETIAAALLYDSFRYAKLSEAEIRKTLNDEVANLILGANKMQSFHADRKIQQTENLRRLLLAVVEDLRVVLLSLASYTASMRAVVSSKNESLRQLYASDAKEIYAPLANRLGIGQIKWELEDLSFRIQEPLAYKQIASFLDEKRLAREAFIMNCIDEIKTSLEKQNIKSEVTGRAKHIFSIWKKMQRKGVSYEEIYDLHALRIIVSTISECYSALGEVHSLWRHIPKEFDDYIANPKANGYRSLHTAVIGPSGKIIEVQIRTKDMHKQSELGVAAHWRYKEGAAKDQQYETKLVQLRQILKWQEDWVTDSDLSDTFRAEVFRDRVYVLTPKGKVVDLSLGATVLDFAYHIHSEIGNHCRGAKVNGRMVPLTHILKSGDTVEIITSQKGGPSRDWLNPHFGYLKTVRARTKVLQWFKHQDHLDQDKDKELPKEKDKDHLHHKDQKEKALHTEKGSLAAFSLEQSLAKSKAKAAEIIVSGVGNLLCQIARCCKPLPGEDIIGYIAVGKGITVHRKDCGNILRASARQASRLIPVEWGEKTQYLYLADLQVEAHDRQGLIRDITAVLANEHINVTAIRSLSNRNQPIVTLILSLEIPNQELLKLLMRKIQQLPNIISVRRSE